MPAGGSCGSLPRPGGANPAGLGLPLPTSPTWRQPQAPLPAPQRFASRCDPSGEQGRSHYRMGAKGGDYFLPSLSRLRRSPPLVASGVALPEPLFTPSRNACAFRPPLKGEVGRRVYRTELLRSLRSPRSEALSLWERGEAESSALRHVGNEDSPTLRGDAEIPRLFVMAGLDPAIHAMTAEHPFRDPPASTEWHGSPAQGR